MVVCSILEEAYMKRDPFTEQKQCIVLGSHCTLCRKTVCVSPRCSLFYTKRFCIKCAMKHLAEFPEEIQMELEKKEFKNKG
ncbi:hypothetical protein LSAT2_031678 [Lamellibrachia satsuma]|nr:hypothetical protein LSAT2_031678 [Lamellibrachia satsuma]